MKDCLKSMMLIKTLSNPYSVLHVTFNKYTFIKRDSYIAILLYISKKIILRKFSIYFYFIQLLITGVCQKIFNNEYLIIYSELLLRKYNHHRFLNSFSSPFDKA